MDQQSDGSHYSTSFTGSYHDKYAGILEKSYLKKMRNNIIVFISYMYSVAPNYYWLHFLLSIYRIWQLVAPVFFINAKFGNNSFSPTINDIIVAPIYFSPSRLHNKSLEIILGVYCGVMAVILISMIGSSYYFSVNAKLPIWISSIIAFLLGSFGFILQFLASSYSGEIIGQLISGTYPHSLACGIILILLTTVLYFVYTLIFSRIIAISIVFRPISLMTLSSLPQRLLYHFTNLIAFLLGIASNLESKVAVYIIILVVLLYGAINSFIYLNGGFLSFYHNINISACSTGGCITLLITVIFWFLKITVTDVLLVVYLIIWVIQTLISYVSLRRMKKKNLFRLDHIYDDDEEFTLMIKNHLQYTSVLNTGFSTSHPVCTNWKICQLAANTWPNNVDIWFLFAKFTAIYPEETPLLISIEKSILQNNIKGENVKQVKEQIGTLIKQREPNLSVTLKQKINKVNKLVHSTKHKLRNVWDMIIQSNIGEMESSIYKTYSSVEQCEAEYNHILRQFPNNRFIVRAYSRFELEVQANIKKFLFFDNSCKILSRGIQYNEDQAHELGLHAFPLLPLTVRENLMIMKIGSESFEDASNTELAFQESSEKNNYQTEKQISLADIIDNITIQSFHITKIVRFVGLLIFNLMVILAGIISVYILLSDLEKPLDYIYGLTFFRSLVFHLTAYSMNYVFESLPQYSNLSTRFPDNDDLSYLGSSNSTLDQYKFLLSQASQVSVIIMQMQDFKIGNPYFDNARSKLSANKMLFTIFPTMNEKVDILTTPFAMFQDFIRLGSNLSSTGNLTVGELNSPAIQTSINNMGALASVATDSLQEISNYMLWMHDRTTFIVKIVFYGMMILSPLALLMMNFVLLFKMNYNKLEIYRCLASLPKNVVSNIAEKLKVLKAENTSDQSASFEGESNKQEENIMKIIATSDSSWQGHISNYIVNTIGTVLISAFTVLALYFLSDLFITQSKLLYEAAPHIDYLMGAFGYQTGSMITLMMMAAEGSGTPIPSIRIQRLIESFETWRNTSNYLMNELRYGDLNENISPFKEFANSITNSVETANCSDPVSISNMHDIYQCFQPEVSYLLFDSFADALSTPYIQTNGSNSFSFANEIYSQLWHIENVHLYNNFFSPLLENIVSTVTDGIKSDLPPVFAVAACCTIASIGIELIIFRFNLEEEKRVKYAIRLLIHCPLQVITQSQKIMNLLDGNFNEKLNDFVGKNNSYYDEIANNLPDSIICESSDHIVTYVNISACRLFNKDSKIGIPTSDFLNMKGDAIFIQSVKNYDINGENSIEYVSEDNTNYHIELTISGFKNERILSFKDQTAMMRYNKLIEEERAKTDALLASIIPKNLVQRVQSGETNISFSVQSVSIVFIDIVEFTPWCGSNPASDVMNTLNNLFSRFDRIVNTKDTMTRIKCIGDCYMGAGGIFSEVNQPSVHAKEIVEFGLAAIDALHQLNKEINQNLRIRVGVNTGGPIVAGVLGVSKPTFEILGPAINMAQQMEHFGVPMNVHISRSVYELIYGDTFHIKERGEIELKKGKAVTYLVTGYK